MKRPVLFSVLAVVPLVVAGCGGGANLGGVGASAGAPPPPVTAAAAPPAPGISSEDLVGRWGYTSYHREADRTRTLAAARGLCGSPYGISRGPRGGVMMHLPDQPQPTEMRAKAGADGKRYLGPDGPAPDALDREIVSFDGRVLTLRWIDPEVAGRYGTAVYVRCAPRA
jgi:hypothetical protein